MNASKFLVTTTAAIAVVSAIGFASAQTPNSATSNNPNTSNEVGSPPNQSPTTSPSMRTPQQTGSSGMNNGSMSRTNPSAASNNPNANNELGSPPNQSAPTGAVGAGSSMGNERPGRTDRN